jgi:ABC-type transporter MlaC component
VYDIVVDDASQVQTYRKNFKNILDKEGWPGLMTRMKKAAEKKV